ncbi:unnamed protein product [Clonostachys byssicola]|uniref:Uncharacterized protein n=1 Tax=Clonostachys byssicola TaxID=160290 RepID=A0A9N9UZ19_9HYPO|nr:unnamed protein product [Clonostachys byssicola]
MVIGLLMLAAIPTVAGVGNAISAQQRQQEAAKDQVKFHLTALIKLGGEYQEGAFCTLADNQMFIDLPDYPAPGHRFHGWYFKYPSEEGHMGLVSSISVDPPALNWIYIDKDTGQVRHGARKDTVDHVIGPWHWSDDEELLTLKEDYEPFVAKREEGGQGRFCVYWDPEHKMEDCLRLRLRRRVQQGVNSRFVKN